MPVNFPIQTIDTSVIVRYLSNDIPSLASRARRLIDSDIPLGITSVAILESNFVLRSPRYGYERDSVLDGLKLILGRENIIGIGIDTAQAIAALERCKGSSKVSVGDALIAATCLTAGVTAVYTFDAQFTRSGLRIAPFPTDSSSL
ncbi:MAG: PIN domain-containing protein [Chloroflexota bacterium]